LSVIIPSGIISTTDPTPAMTQHLLPGSLQPDGRPATLGVMGGGQLGRMFVQAAQRMGYVTAVLDPDPASPAGLVAHHHIQAGYEDAAGLAQLVQHCDAITTEFENVPSASLTELATQRFVAPSGQAVAIAQNRIAEKAMLAQVGAETGASPVPYAPIEKVIDITLIGDELLPGFLKTATMGYDGKGQQRVTSRGQATIAWKQMNSVTCVLEQIAPLAAECSVIVARNAAGECVTLPVARNAHVNNILAASEVFEGNLPSALVAKAQAATKKIAQHLQYVGVLCVEFFILQDAAGGISESSRLHANEIAPRPHNSGHWSIEGCSLSQFELQVRTLAGLPLPEPQLVQPSVMLNILGDIWFDGEAQQTPNWAAILALPGVYLHLYGKLDARKGRKMGHVTVCAATREAVQARASEVAAILGIPYTPT
jgi:5-(carboxyamino)imidazole ribonucleotide synthase